MTRKHKLCCLTGGSGASVCLSSEHCLSFADLHRAREKQTASFTLLCKDAAGESMGRGGDNVQVAVVPKDKKDRCVVNLPYVVGSEEETGASELLEM